MPPLCLGRGVGEIGLATVFVFGQMISGFDEKWFPLVFQQMDWNHEVRKNI